MELTSSATSVSDDPFSLSAGRALHDLACGCSPRALGLGPETATGMQMLQRQMMQCYSRWWNATAAEGQGGSTLHRRKGQSTPDPPASKAWLGPPAPPPAAAGATPARAPRGQPPAPHAPAGDPPQSSSAAQPPAGALPESPGGGPPPSSCPAPQPPAGALAGSAAATPATAPGRPSPGGSACLLEPLLAASAQQSSPPRELLSAEFRSDGTHLRWTVAKETRTNAAHWRMTGPLHRAEDLPLDADRMKLIASPSIR